MKTWFSNVAALLWSWPQMGSTHTHACIHTRAHTVSSTLTGWLQSDLGAWRRWLEEHLFVSGLFSIWAGRVTMETGAYVLTHYVSSAFTVTFKYLQWQLSDHNLFSRQCFVCTTDTHRVAQAESTSNFAHYHFLKRRFCQSSCLTICKCFIL